MILARKSVGVGVGVEYEANHPQTDRQIDVEQNNGPHLGQVVRVREWNGLD